MNNSILLSPYQLGKINLNNRIVMSPMTRSRAIGNIPNQLMAKYYAQRASAGLIITEGTSPSPNGLGYSRIPGIYSEDQIEGWTLITEEVHEKKGKIFLQIMHTGRISHSGNMPGNAVILAPSAIKPKGKMWTDADGLMDFPTPKAMTIEEINLTQNEYITGAVNAIKAGFDGIELHGANGYLIEEFLSPVSNTRTDEYGGSIENRCHFLLEIVTGIIAAIGKQKVGVRLSPYGTASDMPQYPEIDDTYSYLAKELSNKGIVYIHLVDHSSMGAPRVPREIKTNIRKIFRNTLILSGGYTAESAEKELQSGQADLITFGRPFINNPDLVERIKNNWPISKDLDQGTFYSPGEVGYTDYPFHYIGYQNENNDDSN